MGDHQTEHFVRLPNQLLMGLLTTPLTAVQLRIVLWVIRNTAGWNQRLTSFTWYQIAKEMGLDRASLFRAGRRLLAAKVLYVEDGRLGIHAEPRRWTQAALSGGNVATGQRKALLPDNASVATEQRDRCLEATLFRRAKDSSKDRLKTYIDGRRGGANHPQELVAVAARNSPRRPLAGSAKPIPGKYDGLSED